MKTKPMTPSEMGKKGWANSYAKLSPEQRKKQAGKGGRQRAANFKKRNKPV